MGGIILKAVSKNKNERVSSNADSVFDFSANLITGERVNFADVCKGKKCTIVVNVAQN